MFILLKASLYLRLSAIVVIIPLFIFTIRVEATLSLTNMTCTSLREDFISYPVCSLKVPTYGSAVISIHAKLQPTYAGIPLNKLINVTLNAVFWKKKGNVYKQFDYNTTHNVCEMLKTPRRFPFATIVFKLFSKYSNFNHTCPYDHDIIVRNQPLHSSDLRYVPFIRGQYMLQMIFALYNKPCAELKFYVTNT